MRRARFPTREAGAASGAPARRTRNVRSFACDRSTAQLPRRYTDRVVEVTVVQSPIGPLTIGTRGERVCALFFGDAAEDVRKAAARWYPEERIAVEASGAREAVAAVRTYFDGDVHAIDGIEVELNGTPFQLRVWQALRRVAPGETASYSEIARTIDAPAAVRAVGAANGANPVAIIVPCHRIVGANGSLTVYGGGLDRKRWLLAHERLARVAG
jgi:methylated-DNA-[protein]-cysteine S-methyltransferase